MLHDGHGILSCIVACMSEVRPDVWRMSGVRLCVHDGACTVTTCYMLHVRYETSYKNHTLNGDFSIVNIECALCGTISATEDETTCVV